MTNDEIKEYFNGCVIYTYSGEISELKSLLEQKSISFNYLLTGFILYFVIPSNESLGFTDEKINVFYTPEGL